MKELRYTATENMDLKAGDTVLFDYDDENGGQDIRLVSVTATAKAKPKDNKDLESDERFSLLRPIEKFWVTLQSQNDDASDLYRSLEHRKNYYGASYGMSDSEIDMCLITEALLPWAPYLKAHPDSDR